MNQVQKIAKYSNVFYHNLIDNSNAMQTAEDKDGHALQQNQQYWPVRRQSEALIGKYTRWNVTSQESYPKESNLHT